MRNSSYIDLSFIDKNIKNEWFSIMRKNVDESIISKDELDFVLASLISDPSIVEKISWWANCNNKSFLINQIVTSKSELWFYTNFEEQAKDRIEMSEDSIEELWIMFDNLNDDDENEIWTLRSWIKEKESEFSYKRDTEYVNQKWLKDNFDKGQRIFNKKISKLNIADIALNHILEMIIRDLIQDIIDKIIENDDNYDGAKIYKTNQYDDMMCGTDFVIKFNKINKEQSFLAIDMTTAKNQWTLEYKESKKKYNILWDLSTHMWERMGMEKNIWNIDKSFAFAIIKEYTNQLLNWDKILKWDTMTIAKNIEKRLNTNHLKDMTYQIKKSLSDNLAA